MEEIIKLEHVSKVFKTLNRREGLRGSIKDLFSRDYQYLTAVNDVSVDIMPGEIVGYLGPNGAGKSTTIKMMTGVLEPSQGNILVNGVIPYKHRTQNAEHIGVVFGQRTQLWWDLPLIESLKILKEMYRIPEQVYKDNLEFYDALVHASDLYHKPVRQMSLGQRTLSDILAAFLHNPSVVFLDEPTIGLDVSMKSKIRDLICALNEKINTTVILTTHDMGDVDALCKRIIIIDKGTCLYDNDIEHLREFFGKYRTLKIETDWDGTDSEAYLNQMQNLLVKQNEKCSSIQISEEGGWIGLLVDENQLPLMQVLHLLENEYKIKDMRIEEISTESVIKKIYEEETI